MSETIAAPRITGRVAAVTILLAALAAPFASATSPEPLGATTVTARTGVSVDPAVSAALREGPADAIVQLEPAARSAARDAITAAGGTLGVDLGIVDGFAATLTPAALDALRGIPGVVSVTLDGEVTLSHDAALGEGNGDGVFPETVGGQSLRDRGIDGSGIGIAVVDTGIAAIPDLEGRIVGGLDLSGEGDTIDRFGHGTFIAGIAAGDGSASSGKFDGVAPGAHVIPVKLAGADGATDVSNVLAGIQWVVSYKDTYGIRVMNLSLGTDSRQPNALSPLNYAVQKAWDSGLVVIVSAGNKGELGSGHMPKPADDPLVITVGATDSQGTKPRHDDVVAAYSSRGPSLADGVVKPDIVAPGSHLIATKAPGSTTDVLAVDARIRTDYMRGSGTSFAAAVVSGSVALLLQAHPDWTPDQVKGALTATATPGPVGDPNVDGAGVIDVATAAALQDPAPANVGVVRATGLGTLADARGSLANELVVDPLLGLTITLTGELTARNEIFDVVEYTTEPWTGNQWGGNQWGGNQWGGNQWGAAGWLGNQWGGNQWGGNQWGGNQWGGNQWGSNSWYVAEWS